MGWTLLAGLVRKWVEAESRSFEPFTFDVILKSQSDPNLTKSLNFHTLLTTFPPLLIIGPSRIL